MDPSPMYKLTITSETYALQQAFVALLYGECKLAIGQQKRLLIFTQHFQLLFIGLHWLQRCHIGKVAIENEMKMKLSSELKYFD